MIKNGGVEQEWGRLPAAAVQEPCDRAVGKLRVVWLEYPGRDTLQSEGKKERM